MYVFINIMLDMPIQLFASWKRALSVLGYSSAPSAIFSTTDFSASILIAPFTRVRDKKLLCHGLHRLCLYKYYLMGRGVNYATWFRERETSESIFRPNNP